MTVNSNKKESFIIFSKISIQTNNLFIVIIFVLILNLSINQFTFNPIIKIVMVFLKLKLII